MRKKYYRYGIMDDVDVPLDGFVKFEDDKKGELFAVVVYKKIISEKVMKEYGLIDLNEKPDSKIGTLRIKAGLTQSELADIVGASPRTVQTWENEGMSNASLSYAYRVSKVLRCPMTALLNAEDLKWKPNPS